MQLDIGGKETLEATLEDVWRALNDPDTLTRCLPGCKSMTEVALDEYKVDMQLKVASVGGSFKGQIALSEKLAPQSCRITVSGSGTLGHGTGSAHFTLAEVDAVSTSLVYEGQGEIGGLVAGVGQRILKGVAKHLIKKFFAELRVALAPAETSA